METVLCAYNIILVSYPLVLCWFCLVFPHCNFLLTCHAYVLPGCGSPSLFKAGWAGTTADWAEIHSGLYPPAEGKGGVIKIGICGAWCRQPNWGWHLLSEVSIISGRNWKGPADLGISIFTERPLDFLWVRYPREWEHSISAQPDHSLRCCPWGRLVTMTCNF